MRDTREFFFFGRRNEESRFFTDRVFHSSGSYRRGLRPHFSHSHVSNSKSGDAIKLCPSPGWLLPSTVSACMRKPLVSGARPMVCFLVTACRSLQRELEWACPPAIFLSLDGPRMHEILPTAVDIGCRNMTFHIQKESFVHCMLTFLVSCIGEWKNQTNRIM